MTDAPADPLKTRFPSLRARVVIASVVAIVYGALSYAERHDVSHIGLAEVSPLQNLVAAAALVAGAVTLEVAASHGWPSLLPASAAGARVVGATAIGIAVASLAFAVAGVMP